MADEQAAGIGIEKTVDALVQAMVVWDDENYQHCVRTAEYAAAIAAELGLEGQAAEYVRIGALLHDIGKISVDLAVLRKPDRLNADERAHVHLHPAAGASILERVLPAEVVECAASHHEQPDGKGYPEGLAESEIPLGALICRVADVLDSLTSDQSYRAAMTVDEALTELRDGAGTRYSRQIVDVLLDLIEHRQLHLAA
jgi:putative nucleotidyltransferase with HDIG domain